MGRTQNRYTQIIEKINRNELEWDDLLTTAKDSFCVEYVDVAEENCAMIALNPEYLANNNKENEKYYEYTHCEISPQFILGVVGPGQIMIIVLVIVLLFFGGKKIPELMKGLGKGVKEFNDASKGNDASSSTEVSKTEAEEK